ncbi:hypothetical protein DL240_16570 [Lujinxingia litoralis]|uniref:Aromatic hydrocarbon degradation protein n=1 Tax=Lujinxingia litoralis TaxID=2211119 RepID=A0A328C1C9_9DELT|nr:hypothetical protein DL240_16570 [Lujinxingia litoralis]
MLGALALAAALLAAPAALASPFDVYGSGARSAAMAGAQAASAEGPAAVYDNVAELARARTGIRLGAFATLGQAQILLKERPAGYDIPDLGGNGPALPTDQTRRERSDTLEVAPLYGVVIGAVTDFGGTRTRGGAVVMLPTNGLLSMQTHFADERERAFSNQLHFELVGERLRRPVIEAGVGRQITERLHFGIGGTYLPGARATTEAFVRDPADQSDVGLNADIQTTNAWGILAGATLKLPADVRLGLVYRGSVAFAIKGGNEVQVRGASSGEDTRQAIDWVPTFTPASLRLGLAWEPGDLLVTADARYTFWSGYRDTHGQQAGFDDTLEGRLGAQWQSSADTRLRAGLGFVPSPVPAQTGRTNYVDNHRALASLGAEHRFDIWQREVVAAWYVQAHHLLYRTTDKGALGSYPDCGPGVEALCDELPDDTRDPRTGQPYPEAQGLQTGNPGFPGFSSGGWLGAVGFELHY